MCAWVCASFLHPSISIDRPNRLTNEILAVDAEEKTGFRVA